MLDLSDPSARRPPTTKEKPVTSTNSAHPSPASDATQKAAQNDPPLASVERLLRDRRGANLVEYIILVGVVALLALGAFKSFGGDLRTKIGNQATTVQGINDTAEGAQP
jgi:pilus assembly protein Flp/PilA